MNHELSTMSLILRNTTYASRNTRFDLSAEALTKEDQSKQLNYAKQTQFPKKSNGCNASINKELQRKNQLGHLVKTNPKQTQSKPNSKSALAQGRRVLGENIFCIFIS